MVTLFVYQKLPPASDPKEPLAEHLERVRVEVARRYSDFRCEPLAFSERQGMSGLVCTGHSPEFGTEPLVTFIGLEEQDAWWLKVRGTGPAAQREASERDLRAVIGGISRSAERAPYPNELPGFQLYDAAKWKTLRPLVTTTGEARALLGSTESVFSDSDPRWKFMVYYWGEGGTCNGRPFPKSLVGKVDSIQVRPSAPISMAGVEFPPVFHRSEEHSSHDPVGSWDVYEDEFGLRYEVYRHASTNGTVRANDLKAIIYGPTREVLARLAECPHLTKPAQAMELPR